MRKISISEMRSVEAGDLLKRGFNYTANGFSYTIMNTTIEFSISGSGFKGISIYKETESETLPQEYYLVAGFNGGKLIWKINLNELFGINLI